jgi:NAD(P)H-hydrate epimerase
MAKSTRNKKRTPTLPPPPSDPNLSAPAERVYVLPPLPPRPADGHKGTFGRILIVGGSDEMLGAPVFAGTAALRCGAGLVHVALAEHLLPHALTLTPELIGHALTDSPKSLRRLLDDADKADVIVAGPGMGLGKPARKRLLALLEAAESKILVLDADALTLLSQEKKWRAPKPDLNWIITPHPGEMKRLGKLFGSETIAQGDDARTALARQAATHLRLHVILKGARTVVTDGHRVYIDPAADSSLAKAGTGDILAGTLAAFSAVLPNLFQAAALAVHTHAQAGIHAGQKLGPHSTLATDILNALPNAIQKLATDGHR